jgi:hypothetical protein
LDLNPNGGSTTWRTLRAFTWMRWRTLVNALDRTGSRDIIERFSLAVEQVAPLLAMAMLVPSALALAGLAGYAGYWLSGTARVVTFDVVRFLLLIGSGFCLIGPLVMPAMERTSAVRLLLLPIRRGTLYVAQAGSALSDPWVILALPLVLGLPVGLVLGGAAAAALVALAAGLLLGTVLIGLSAFASFLLNLIVRDRRRAEMAALLFVLVPALLMLPGLLNSGGSRDERHAERTAAAERRARGETTFTDRAWSTGQAALRFLPSELYTTAVRSASSGDLSRSAMPLAGLMTFALVVHGLGLAVFSRLLEVPSGGTRQKASDDSGRSTSRLPGLSRTSSAVAIAQLRLALRTTRGKSTILSPLLVFLMMMFVASRNTDRFDVGVTTIAGGFGLAAFGSMICLLSILPFSMNQFAVDRAGLTLVMLAPVSLRELLIGKAVGTGAIAFLPAMICTLMAGLYFRDWPLALWLCLPTAMIATIAIGSPGAAALSALFPRSVDLNSIGRGSNAHGVAGLLGMLAFVAAAAPGAVLAMVVGVGMQRPRLAPVLIVVWTVVALGIGLLLFRVAADIFDRRRENLGLTSQRS